MSGPYRRTPGDLTWLYAELERDRPAGQSDPRMELHLRDRTWHAYLAHFEHGRIVWDAYGYGASPGEAFDRLAQEVEFRRPARLVAERFQHAPVEDDKKKTSGRK